MSAILIISIFLLVLTSFAVFRSKRNSSQEESGQYLPGQGRGLFEGRNSVSTHEDEGNADLRVEASTAGVVSLRARARAGDLKVLHEAQQIGDAGFYHEILDTLVRQCAAAPENLRLLCSTITGSKELRSSTFLAATFLESWKQNPSRMLTAELLHVAALSDDAVMFEHTIVTVFDFWLAERIPGLSQGGLRALIESEYWVLSSSAKSCGAGFVLREKIAEISRRLFTEGRREITPSAEADGQPPASH